MKPVANEFFSDGNEPEQWRWFLRPDGSWVPQHLWSCDMWLDIHRSSWYWFPAGFDPQNQCWGYKLPKPKYRKAAPLALTEYGKSFEYGSHEYQIYALRKRDIDWRWNLDHQD